jgi:hypothetical protein
MHAEMVKYLSIFLDGASQSKWNIMLGEATFAYNTAYNSILRMSPYEVLFGQLPPIGPLGIPRNTEEETDFEKFYEQHRGQITYKRQLAQQGINRWQDMVLKQRNRFSHEMKFSVDDKVLYKNHVLKNKFDNKFKGPWKITKVLSPVLYELQAEDKKFVAHAAYMKLYKETPKDSAVSVNVEMDAIEPPEELERNDDNSNTQEVYLEEVTDNQPNQSTLSPIREPLHHSTPIRHGTPMNSRPGSPGTPNSIVRTPRLRSLLRSVFTPLSSRSNREELRVGKRSRHFPKYLKDNYVLK